MPTARLATHADLPDITALLTRAFHDDPLNSWVLPDAAQRRRRSPAMFRVGARTAMGKGGVWTDETRSGAAMWAAPGRWRDRPRDVVRQLPGLLSLGGGIPRVVRAFRIIEQQHPAEDHWYLDGLGTDPDRQGTGIASALMQPVLDRCDSDSVGAFLVSSNIANLPFYERHGFRVTGEDRVPTGPVLYAMWREPRGPRPSVR